jgi:hypothetical protein
MTSLVVFAIIVAAKVGASAQERKVSMRSVCQYRRQNAAAQPVRNRSRPHHLLRLKRCWCRTAPARSAPSLSRLRRYGIARTQIADPGLLSCGYDPQGNGAGLPCPYGVPSK